MEESRKRAALLEGFIHMGDTDNNTNTNINDNNNNNKIIINGNRREGGCIDDDYNLNHINGNGYNDYMNNNGGNSGDNNGNGNGNGNDNGNEDEQTMTVIKEFNIAKDYVEMDEDDPFGDPRHHVPAG